jgi:TPR repeat protein
LGAWNVRIGYLRILSLNSLADLSDVETQHTNSLIAEVDKYITFADKNPSEVNDDRYREVYEIHKKINELKKYYGLSTTELLDKALKLYEVKKYDEAIKILNIATNKGSIDAMNYIGSIYYEAKKYDLALDWYKKAANKGDAVAMYALGTIYYLGNGVVQDFKQALYWLKKSADAESEDNRLYYIIGNMYTEGQGVEKDYSEAINWYKRSAKKGNATAMNDIGAFYAGGLLGGKKDFAQAEIWFKKAIDVGGVKESLNWLSFIYSEGGYGIKKDKKLAAEYKAKYEAAQKK